MKLIDGIKYYSASDVGVIVGKDRQTINRWDKASDELEKQGKQRLIPKPLRGEDYTVRNIQTKEITKTKGKRMWSEHDLGEIKKFSETKEKGMLAEFNRTQWGEKGRRIIAEKKGLINE